MTWPPSRMTRCKSLMTDEAGRGFLVAEMWTSLAISVIWVTVLLDALFGPDIRTTSAGGDSSVIPSAIVIAILAFFATWVVAKHGFRHERAN